MFGFDYNAIIIKTYSLHFSFCFYFLELKNRLKKIIICDINNTITHSQGTIWCCACYVLCMLCVLCVESTTFILLVLRARILLLRILNLIKHTINPYNRLLKNTNFSIKTTHDYITSYIIKYPIYCCFEQHNLFFCTIL